MDSGSESDRMLSLRVPDLGQVMRDAQIWAKLVMPDGSGFTCSGVPQRLGLGIRQLEQPVRTTCLGLRSGEDVVRSRFKLKPV